MHTRSLRIAPYLPGLVALGSFIAASPMAHGQPFAFATLASLSGTAGSPPGDFLTVSADGKTIYGTTQADGNTDGTVISIPVYGGTPTVLTTFTGLNGANPTGLTLSADGKTLYGTTSGGGSGNGDGTVFSLPVEGGSPKLLATFNGSNGESPESRLILIGTTLYGTTQLGGANNDGTLFSLSVGGGAITVLVSFDGTNPSGLTLSSDGKTMYGTTQSGGANNYGTVFSLPVGGKTLTTIASFTGPYQPVPSGVTLSRDGKSLFGTTEDGGDNGDGSVFTVPISGGSPTTLASFSGVNGLAPVAGLTLSADGTTLYGTAEEGCVGWDPAGNTWGDGIVFSVPVTGGVPSVMVAFDGTNGSNPFCTLTPSSDGKTLYGTTSAGGANSGGSLFSVSTVLTAPLITTLTAFTGSNGSWPNPDLKLSRDGRTLYGTISDLASSVSGAFGTVFSVPVTGGSATTLVSFNYYDGFEPFSGVTVSADGGTLYGTTGYGGTNDDGTVYSIASAGGTLTTLANFDGSNGSAPLGEMVLAGNTLFGTTEFGGANGLGTVFSIPAGGGAVTSLASFNGNNGSYPVSDLTLSSDGSRLYGITGGGGAHGDGTIFSISIRGGEITTLASFNGTDGSEFDTDGSMNSAGGLTLSPDGSTLYGTTPVGGAASAGTVFSIPASGGPIHTIVSFDGSAGTEPCGDLSLSSDGSTLYGTTEVGGPGGTIFSVPVTGGLVTTLAYFSGPDGSSPVGAVTISDNKFYGTTESGGDGGNGTVFSMTLPAASPALTTLATFDGTNGSGPIGNLILAGNMFYGAASNSGTIFSVPVGGGQVTTLGSSTGGLLENPDAGLTLVGSTLCGCIAGGPTGGAVYSMPLSGGSPKTLAAFGSVSPTGHLTNIGGSLYGVTDGGEEGGDVTVFSIPVTGGQPRTLADISGDVSYGSYPTGGLLAVGNTLYGASFTGGNYFSGSVFSVPIGGGSVTTLASFDATNGEYPQCDLLLSADGKTFYGTTNEGGSTYISGNQYSGYGTIFSVPVGGGAITTLANFTATTGGNSVTGLTLSSDGSTLFGTTSDGGATNDGTLFSLPAIGGPITTLVDFDGSDGANPKTALMLSSDGSTLYGATANGGGFYSNGAYSGDGTLFSLTLRPILKATGGSSRVFLSWAAAAGAASYRVYRGTTAGGESATPVAAGVAATTYTDTGLTNGETYYYKVSAAMSTGKLIGSNEAFATPHVLTPPAPTDLTAKAGNEQITLTWDESVSATSYSICRSTTSDAESATPIATAVMTSFTNTGLTNGTTYYYIVKAVNSYGTGPISNQASATPKLASPLPPTGLTAKAGNEQITLTWAASLTATSYNVFRGTVSGGETTTVATGITSTTFDNTGLTNGKAYYYVVKAVNAVGTSAKSNEASATPVLAVPLPPTNLTATGSSGQVALSWTGSVSATSYNVYRGTTSDGESGSAVAIDISVTHYTNTGLINGKTYYYFAKAVNAIGTSKVSNQASATP